ncbi:MAG: Stp1/IreP family PP2C-type Ser/Thr phosphatase [Anaerovoracaceae bacterium]|jgi:protein phosphatase|nr:Stp1/IreP family PP2C-type Ser/Thr phosphatase [Anaerovoracaceae bacterium]
MKQVGFKSDKGLKRKNNEDACFIMPKEEVFILADGVGGGASGEIASRTTVSMIAEYVRKNPPKAITDVARAKDYFLPSIQEVNSSLFSMAKKHIENQGMATTLVVCHVNGKRAYFANIGDSRAYIFRKGKLKQITEDHSYVNDLVKTGVITEKAAQTHEKKNMITKALGGDEICEPDFYQAKIEKDDIIFLCSDGLYSELEEEVIVKIFTEAESMTDLASELVKKANQRGGRDNITVICVKV